jgi:hypothetical protein
MWRWLLDEFYNNPKYTDIVYRPFDAGGKMLMFLPSPLTPAYVHHLLRLLAVARRSTP